MSKIDTERLYKEIARLIPDFPICPEKFYPEWRGWCEFLGKDKKLSPRLIREWHPTKNGKLTSKDVTIGSSRKVWWKCKESHEWRAVVSGRSGHGTRPGSNCPYCSGRRATKDTCLAVTNPVLAKEWHPTKNGKITPRNITCSSGKKFWWKCQEGHEWQAPPNNRSNGRGCPYCRNRIVDKDNCLATLNPKLTKEWHPTKNGKLKPRDVIPGSHKKVWWKCEKSHEWKAAIYSRSSGCVCPMCCGRIVTLETCLVTINPQLAKEWHPTKNGKLKPRDVMPNTAKKVWWLCDNGHEWKASPNARHGKNRGCGFCVGQRVNKDNCLATVKPELAREWHPTKNGKLTSKDVIPGSHKKAWWKCKKNHEWQAEIKSRSRGCGCPHCYRLRRTA